MRITILNVEMTIAFEINKYLLIKLDIFLL